jgi:hypothetical protein
MTAAMTGTVIAGQKMTIRPASRLSHPVTPVSARPGAALPAATRSTSPCITQNSPATSDNSTTVTAVSPRQKIPASTARVPISRCVPRCVPARPLVTPSASRSAPVARSAMPSRAAVTASESFCQKTRRGPRASRAAATARVSRRAPRAASGPGSAGDGARASDEVIAACPPPPRVLRHCPCSGPDSQHPGRVRYLPARPRRGPRPAWRGNRGLPGAVAALDLAGVAASSAAGARTAGAPRSRPQPTCRAGHQRAGEQGVTPP